MRQIVLIPGLLSTIAMMACVPFATTSESEDKTEQANPAWLLSEESAISILRAYLQERTLQRGKYCVDQHTPSYSILREQPIDFQGKNAWLMDLATGAIEDFAWSANYHGVTEIPELDPMLGIPKAETWVVIGPGLEDAESQFVVPGRWKVYAGHQKAYYLDAPVRFAFWAYEKHDSCDW